MGRDTRTATIHATVSRHNSGQDDIDDALWDKLLAEVRAIVNKPEYEPIRPDLG
jgi:hypothetical protein